MSSLKEIKKLIDDKNELNNLAWKFLLVAEDRLLDLEEERLRAHPAIVLDITERITHFKLLRKEIERTLKKVKE